MRCLIRNISRQGKIGAIYHDKPVSSKRLTLGRGVDQHVFFTDLRIALQHAEISPHHEDAFLLQSKSLAGFRVNERLLQSAIIQVGNKIQLGNSLIQVLPPEKGYDLVLEVEDRPNLQNINHLLHHRVKLRLNETRLSLRRLSWIAALSILFIFALIPLASVYLQDIYVPWQMDIEAWLSEDKEDYVELPPLPTLISDRFWNSGQLASAHHFFRQDCSTCHNKAFEPVTDKACVQCHDKTHPHVDPNFYELETFSTRCAACHQDHNGKTQLIRKDDTFCSKCHQDLSKQGVDTALLDAQDFTMLHPAFKPTLISFDYAKQQEITKTVRMDDEKHFIEKSNLKFPHDVHVSRKGLVNFDEVKHLWCEDCHTPEAGGIGFSPINYESHCSECHRLNFDPMEDDRFVPHGQVGNVIYTLQEYYGSWALKGGYLNDDDAPNIVQQARFPNETLSGNDRMIALNWAHNKALETAEEVFEFSLCIECHQVEKPQEDPPKWDIVPVRINSRWLPRSNFKHEKHLTTNCVFCHLAPESNQSEEILLPDIESCRNCHGGIHSKDKLQSTCVDCHDFHVAKEFTMGHDTEMLEAAID